MLKPCPPPKTGPLRHPPTLPSHSSQPQASISISCNIRTCTTAYKTAPLEMAHQPSTTRYTRPSLLYRQSEAIPETIALGHRQDKILEPFLRRARKRLNSYRTPAFKGTSTAVSHTNHLRRINSFNHPPIPLVYRQSCGTSISLHKWDHNGCRPRRRRPSRLERKTSAPKRRHPTPIMVVESAPLRTEDKYTDQMYLMALVRVSPLVLLWVRISPVLPCRHMVRLSNRISNDRRCTR